MPIIQPRSCTKAGWGTAEASSYSAIWLPLVAAATPRSYADSMTRGRSGDNLADSSGVNARKLLFGTPAGR
jgi:hypothetical protein